MPISASGMPLPYNDDEKKRKEALKQRSGGPLGSARASMPAGAANNGADRQRDFVPSPGMAPTPTPPPIPGVIRQPMTREELYSRGINNLTQAAGDFLGVPEMQRGYEKHGFAGALGAKAGQEARRVAGVGTGVWDAMSDGFNNTAGGFKEGLSPSPPPSSPRSGAANMPSATTPTNNDGVQTVPNAYTDQTVLGRDTDGDGKLDAFSDATNRATLTGGTAAPLPNNGNPVIFGTSDGQRSEFVTTPNTRENNGNDLSVANALNARADAMRDSRLENNRELIQAREQRWATADQSRQHRQAREMLARADAISKQITNDVMPRNKRVALQDEAQSLRNTAAAFMGGSGGQQGGMTEHQASQLGLQQQQLGLQQRQFSAERREKARDDARQEYEAMGQEGRERLELFFGKDNVPDIMSFYVEARPQMEEALGIKLSPNISTEQDSVLSEIRRRWRQFQNQKAAYDNSFFTRPFRTEPIPGN